MNTLTLSDADYEVAIEALHKHWDEQKRQTAIENWTTRFGLWVNACINAIGLEETKKLIRNANRNLRMIEEKDAC